MVYEFVNHFPAILIIFRIFRLVVQHWLKSVVISTEKEKILKALYKNIHQEVIDRCIDGDETARFQLYKIYYKPMYSVSLRIVNNEADAEDIMQEAFLKAFQKINSYRGEVSFGAWLKKIVINRSLDYLKKRKLHFNELTQQIPDISETDNSYQDINLLAINNAIRKLPDGYRVVLSLFLLEGYSHKEISKILGISNSNSRTQYLRAKNKLRELLKKEEIYRYN